MKKRNRSLKDIWKQVPPDYYEKGIKANIFQFIWHNWKWWTMKKILLSLNPKPEKILDVGCSSGHITSRITKLYPKAKISGLDSYDQAINLGKKIHPQIKFYLGDAHKLPFKNDTFDLITCTETVEHLADSKKAISEMKRCLKKRGYLLIGQDTDNIFFKIIWSIWTRTFGRVWWDSHLHPFTPKHFEDLVKENKLKIKNKKFSQLGLEVFFLVKKI